MRHKYSHISRSKNSTIKEPLANTSILRLPMLYYSHSVKMVISPIEGLKPLLVQGKTYQVLVKMVISPIEGLKHDESKTTQECRYRQNGDKPD